VLLITFVPKGSGLLVLKKLDGGLVSFSNEHTYQIEGISTIRIKLFDEMIRKLKDVRYVPQSQKNLILVGTLEAKGLRGTLREGVLKMSSGSLVILKAFDVTTYIT